MNSNSFLVNVHQEIILEYLKKILFRYLVFLKHVILSPLIFTANTALSKQNLG